jgi:hypothetical protein
MTMPLSANTPVAGAWRQGQRLAFVGCGVALALFAAPASADPAPLATFRSVHDLVLDPSLASQGILAVTARLVTEFTGSLCQGYTDQTRFVMQTTDDGGARQTSDLRQTTVETAAGHFTFDEKVYANNKLAEQSLGVADRGVDGKLAVTITRPGNKQISIPAPVVFPTELMMKTVAAAKEGKHFLALDLYSGDAAGETVYATSTVIGPPSTAADFGADTPIGQANFATLPHWQVTVAYFEKSGAADNAPIYTTSYVLYENGMAGHLKIAYTDFTLVGTLTSLDILPGAPCP